MEPQIEHIFRQNPDKRIVVVGTTCTGKSTLLEVLKRLGVKARDMDELLFPNLTPEENRSVAASPWTPQVGRLMDRLAKKYVHVQAGEPVFGTIVFDSDLIVYIRISDDLLRKRTEERGVSFDEAKGMQRWIEQQVKASGLPVIEILI